MKKISRYNIKYIAKLHVYILICLMLLAIPYMFFRYVLSFYIFIGSLIYTILFDLFYRPKNLICRGNTGIENIVYSISNILSFGFLVILTLNVIENINPYLFLKITKLIEL